MSESWRSDIARMKNRWLIIAVVAVSLLFHVALGVLFWKSEKLMFKAPEQEIMPVELVSAPPDRVRDKLTEGTIVEKKLPANNKPPARAKVIADKDNTVAEETYNKNLPFNKNVNDIGKKGQGVRPESRPGKGDKPKPGSDSKSKAKSSSDLINSVSYKSLPVSGSKGAQSRGGGNLSPYNPKIGKPGDVVNINTKSFKYISYFAGIKEKIEWAWVYPQKAQMSGQQGVLTMTFTILRNGSLKNVKLVRSSGYRLLDNAAMQAVRDAAAFAPMPETWEDKELTILANFEYRLVGAKYVF